MQENMKYKYGAAVICYNPDSKVASRISLYSTLFLQVLVIDNSDVDKHLKEEHFPENVIYYDMNGNQGMSRALNIAYKWGIGQKFDYLLTMDQDSVYSAENINNMLSYIEKNSAPDVAIYVANFAKLYRNPKDGSLVPEQPVIARDSVKEVSMCLTSGSFVKLDAVRQILPLEDYFIAVVDNDISTELIKRGFRLMRIGSSFLAQEVGRPADNTWFNRTFKIVHHTSLRYYYTFRNDGYYEEKNHKNRKLVIRSHIGKLRLIFNILVAEDDKVSKLKACSQGRKDYRKGILGKVPVESIVWK